MKKINFHVMPDTEITVLANALPAHVPKQEDAEDLASATVGYSFAELTELK